MRRAIRVASVVGLCAALPSGATALGWQARAGVDYQRTDGEDTTVPRLDLNVGLDLNGATPGLLTWDGGVAYHRVDTSYNGSGNRQSEVNYRLRSSLFTDPRSPVTVSAQASRITNGASVQDLLARTTTQNVYGGQFNLHAIGKPTLSGGYSYTDTSVDDVLLGPYTRTLQTLTGSTSHGAGAYSYTARYLGSLSEGTFALDNYDDHRVNVDAQAGVSRTGTFRVSDTLYIRKPTLDSSINPRLELNNFSASLRFRSDNKIDDQSAGYFYAHAIQSAPSVLDEERTLHQLSYTLIRGVVLPEWRVQAEADLGYSEDRLGDTVDRAAGETVSGILVWRRTTPLRTSELHAGPAFGLLQPSGESPRFGWGARAGGLVNGDVSFFHAEASYEASYETDLHGVAGWSVRQSATGSLESPLGVARSRTSLQLVTIRRSSPLLGDGSTRSATLISGVTWRRSQAQLHLGVQDGVAGSIAGVGDGLFIAPAFDSHSRFATLSGATAPWLYLVLRGQVRYSSTDLPDRPSVAQTELYGAIEFLYGALRLALEDRYVFANTGTAGYANYNQVFLRAYRVFGSQY